MRIPEIPLVNWLYGSKSAASKVSVFPKYDKATQAELAAARDLGTAWYCGKLPNVPMVLTKPFCEALDKSSKAFAKIEADLWKEFCDKREMGVIISIREGLQFPICYQYDFFGENKLAIFTYAYANGYSHLLNYTITSLTDKLDKDGYHLRSSDTCVRAHEFTYQFAKARLGKDADDFDLFMAREINFMLDEVIFSLALRKYADVEVADITPFKNKNKRVLKPNEVANENAYALEIMDTSWWTSVCNDNDFQVSGHFRLQPKKVNGEWTKELIWINEFTKHGYHRRAKIEKS